MASPEAQREYERTYRERHRERIRLQGREKYAANIEASRASARERSRLYRQRHPERARETGAAAKRTRRLWLAQIKHHLGCVECGLTDPRALDFHHTDVETKVLAVSQLVYRRAWRAVLDEIEKCIVLCANCHRVAHADEEERAAAAGFLGAA